MYKCYKDGRPPPSFDQVIDVDREHAEVEELPLHEDTPEWLRSGTRLYLLRGVDGFRLLRSPLSAAQLSYVASWAAYLASHGCPCIGVMAQEEAP